jgi:hypothetical protein
METAECICMNGIMNVCTDQEYQYQYKITKLSQNIILSSVAIGEDKIRVSFIVKSIN